MIQPQNIDLTDRERQILNATIENYIDHYQPVGSSFLKNEHHFSCSPATIRNALAKLENLGLLSHPFTSAGRIPTDSGYRYYVDHLSEEDSEASAELESAITELHQFANQIDLLLKATAAVLSQTSRYFGIVLLTNIRQSILTGIELVGLSSDRVMLVIEINSGLVQSMVFNLNVEVQYHQLQQIKNALREILEGLSLEEIRNSFQDRVKGSEINNHEIVQILLKNPRAYFSIPTDSQIFTSSLEPLLQYPEFQKIDSFRGLLSGLQSQSIKSYLPGLERQTVIGSENTDERFHEYSILLKDFTLDSVPGQLAILGPRRMPYRFVRTTINKIAELLPHVI